MYILHGHPFSQHSRRCVALLEAAELPYELRVVALDKGAHLEPDFLQLNPNHQIPVLIDEGFVMYESNAIMRYLAVKHDLTSWYPPEPIERARVEQWLDWCQCQMSSQVSGYVFNKMFAGDKADQAAIARAEERLPALFKVLEDGLNGRDFLSASGPTIADLAIGSNLVQLGIASAPDTPAVKAYQERLAAIPAFAKSLPPTG